MKNLLNSVMLFLLLFVAQNAWCTIVAGGVLTTTISWRVEKISGVSKLTVYGTGEMPDYSSNTAVPWAEYRNTVSILEIGDGITKIGSRAFNGIGTTKVSIPSSCKTIGMLAFNGCRKMTDIYIPASVTSISTNAVNNCPKLRFVHYDGRCTSSTAISLATCAETGRFIEKSGTGDSYADVPEGWEYYTHAEKCQGGAWVAENADQTKLFFYAQSSGATVDYASTVVLSENDQDATNHPWRLNCYKYTSLEIDKNIAAIGEDELRGYVNRDVTKMGYINMQTITVQSGNSYFVVGEDGALYDKSKTTVYLYPAKSTATDIEIPATVTTIRPGAFYGAENLQKIDFLGTISTIGTYAFAQTSSLSYLGFASETAPTSTATTAFTGVAKTGVVAASVETNAFKTFTSNIGYGWTFAGETLGPVKSYISNGTLYVVGKGAYSTASSDADWYSQRSSIKKIVVKEGITNIGSSAFADCSNVTEATLNNNGSIEYYAFKDCSALTRVNIGSGVTEFKEHHYFYDNWVYNYPFSGCSRLATVNISDLKSYCSISGLDYLTNSEYGTAANKTLMVNGTAHSSTSELVIPEDIKAIPNSAFRYFSNVTKIKLPSKMTEIASSNFYGHTYLTEITVPSTVSNVGARAFKGCTSLKTATLNNNGNIEDSAFEGCTSLKTATLNNGGNIGSEAFKDCTSLQTVTLNNGGNIGSEAFEGCTSLLTATLNNNGYISYYAFKDCSALTRVNIGSGVTEFKEHHYFYDNWVYNYPFSGCSRLATVNITDLKSYCSIEGIEYLTKSSYGTAESKTLMVNGVTLSSTSELDIPEGVTTIEGCAFYSFTNLTKVKIPSTVTSVTFGAFCKCPNLKRIVCLAPTCPSSSGIIATNPENITLRVRGGTASQYKADSRWKDFNIEEYRYEVQELNMYANEGKDLYTDVKALSWTSSDTDVATVNKLNDVSGRVNTKDFVYDGTISTPYKTVTITADLGDYDTYIWKIRVEPREVELTDGNAYLNTEDIDVEKISYTRSFSKAGAWQALYLPFAFDVEEYKSDFDIAEIYAICPTNDTNGDGVLDSNDDKKFILAPLNTGSTQPNAPYMIRPKAAKSYTIVSENTTLASAEINEVEFATSRTQYSVKGIYAADFYAVPGDNNIYVTASGGFGYAKTKNVNIKPNRWVLHEESKNYCSSTSNSNSKLANFTIEVLGEDLDETTAIKLINGETASEGAKNGSAYNLNGMKVDASKNLPSGLYIINGKKVFKK